MFSLVGKKVLCLSNLQIGTQINFDELTPKNLARAYAEALKPSHRTREAKLPINGAEVTAEIIQEFL